MQTWIALFRGINVGGRNLLSMKELVSIMEYCGHSNTKSYIQSGNLVFNGDSVKAEQISDRILDQKGFRPEVLILDTAEFENAIGNNPFKNAEGKTCHFTFCKDQPESIDEELLNRLKSQTEKFALKGKIFYLHAPDGIGRSKLAGKVERCLGVTTTSRNLNTVIRLAQMVREAAR